MSEPHDPEPTSVMLDGRYQLHERVGEGGMAEVYRAEDVVLGRTVAVKMMRTGSDVLTSPERARNEASALATLNHPSLVTLLDARLVPGRTGYLVMEFIAGTTLAQRLLTGPLSADECAHLAGDVAAGLAAAHAAGIVHRDVKPSNVLLAPAAQPGRPFQAKLADFGVASLLDGARLTSPGTVVGTAVYLSPEQLHGEAAAPAADIYALGLVLLEALTGQRAFPQASGISAVLARLLEAPRVPDEVGPHWSALLKQMTDSDPARRPAASEVAQTVADFAGRTGERAVQLPVALPPPVPARRDATAPVQEPAAGLGAVGTAPAAAHARRRPRSRWLTSAIAAGATALITVPAMLWMTAADPGVSADNSEPPRVVVLPAPAPAAPTTPAADTSTHAVSDRSGTNTAPRQPSAQPTAATSSTSPGWVKNATKRSENNGRAQHTPRASAGPQG